MTKSSSYPVTIGRGLLDRLGEILPEDLLGRTAVLVTSETVGCLYGRDTATALRRLGSVHALSVPDGERAKSMASLTRLLEAMAELRVDRSAYVVALGGGVVGDLAGFVAATYMRGIRLVQLPTTLLAQVDASVGGKVGVNLRHGKNLVGAFHQPSAVIADTKTLETLPGRHVRAGLAEVLKYALIGDLGLWRYLEARIDGELDLDQVVESSVRDKARVVAADEREAGHRRVLNLGHTLGHALETATQYRRYLHGEAVALGILYAFLVARILERTTDEQVAAVLDMVRRIGTPLELPALRFDRIRRLFGIDKKVDRGTLNLVLPVGLGRVQIAGGLPDAVLARAYSDLRDLLASSRHQNQD